MNTTQADQMIEVLGIAGTFGVDLHSATVVLDGSFTAEDLLRIVAVLQQIDKDEQP